MARKKERLISSLALGSVPDLRLKGFLSKEWINIDTLEYIPHLLANIYIHNTEINELKEEIKNK